MAAPPPPEEFGRFGRAGGGADLGGGAGFAGAALVAGGLAV